MRPNAETHLLFIEVIMEKNQPKLLKMEGMKTTNNQIIGLFINQI
jgi:hypothetical protein